MPEAAVHPWMTQRLAEERQCELRRAAARLGAGCQARGAAAGGQRAAHTRVARYVGELLIKTGWRLVGPEPPVSDGRSRLALRGVHAMVDPG